MRWSFTNRIVVAVVYDGSGANVTRLESAFMWIGGWRPTSALVLVYSLMGIDIENALESVHLGRDVAEGSTASLLSTRQLAVMHSLQKHTQHAEMRISKKLTVLQVRSSSYPPSSPCLKIRSR